MEKLILFFGQAISSLADMFFHSDDNSLVFLMDNIIYCCESVSSTTVKFSVTIYKTYEKPRLNTCIQDMYLLILANALNCQRKPFTCYRKGRNLMLCQYFTQSKEDGDEADFVRRTLDSLSSMVVFTKKFIMADKVVGPCLGLQGYLGHQEPQQRIANSHRWTNVRQYTEGLVAVADEQGYYGFLNADCHLVIPCRWTDARPFSEGLAAVADGQGRYGFINHAGTVVIPCEWSRADGFSEGRAAVMAADGRWGSIDRYGRLVQAPH